jgi:hypothetical protein
VTGGADDVALEASADDLDLGSSGIGAQWSGGSVVADGELDRGHDGRVLDAERAAISPYAVSAAACSASFLERPTPLP